MIHYRVSSFIKTIRDSFEGSINVYTEGSCYQFYRILKEVFPESVAFYDGYHVITEIEGRYYDITGEIINPTGYINMETYYEYNEVMDCKFNIFKDL